MHSDQGDKSVQDYYGELQKGLQHCKIVEGAEDAICHFYSGLRRDIQDILDYKDFDTVNKLFQFAMLVEKEVQGRQQSQHRPRSTLAPPPCQRRRLAHLRLLQRPRDLRLPLRPQVNLFSRYPPRNQIR
jgi:hypothetical protein